MRQKDTIIALSTPPGRSGLAIIRLSGGACLDVIQRELGKAAGEHGIMKHGTFRDPESGEVIDRLNFAFMKGPRSSTGEDVLELYPHGSPAVIHAVLETIMKCHESVRIAGPGEFSRRGLENGKMDLLEAEALGELIHAGNRAALRNAARMMGGDLHERISVLKNQLNNISIQLELDVDFSEEEAEPDYLSWEPRLHELRETLCSLQSSWKTGKRLQSDPKVAVFGPPNAGKSSLINSVFRRDRLIVSEIPGTTRDYVEVPVYLQNGMVILVDTAGIGKTEDILEKDAVKKTREILETADYRLLVLDGTNNVAKTENLPERYDFLVYTRADLENFKPSEKLSSSVMAVSNLTGQGIDLLREMLDREIFGKMPGPKDNPVITTERQYRCISSALKCVEKAVSMVENNPGAELLAFEIREARNAIAELTGEHSPEEVLNGIFEKFCIGK